MMVEYCENDCGAIPQSQAETTMKTFNKKLCPKCADAENEKTADQLVPMKVRVRRRLEQEGYEQHNSNQNLYVKGEFPHKRFVDITRIPVAFEIGLLKSDGYRITEEHGLADIDELKGVIEGMMASGKTGNGARKRPEPTVVKDSRTDENEKEHTEEKKGKDEAAKRDKAATPEIIDKPLPTTPPRRPPQSGSGVPPKQKETLPAVRTNQCGFLSPATTIEDALAVFDLFERAKTKLLKDTDVLWIGANGRPTTKGQGHPHIKRSGWRKLARFFGINCCIIDKEKIISSDSEGQYYIWKFRVRAEHPTGGYFEADGVCTSRDPFFSKKNGQRIEPDEADIMMKSQTVAFNRAVSDLLGSGEVSADEIKGVV